MPKKLVHYAELLAQVKQRVRQGQTRAVFSANAEMTLTYWDIGRMILERQEREGWGASVIPRLSRDLRNELPEVKGFSERNIGYMIRFAREYDVPPILQQPVAKLQALENKNDIKVPQAVAKISGDGAQSIVQQLVAKIPWGHNILLMEKIKDASIRLWYMRQIIEQDWTRDVLLSMIKNRAHERQGKAIHNFEANFYCNVVDDRLKHTGDNPTIGLILCQDKKSVLAEYTLRGVAKPIGVSEYELTRALPASLQSALPSVEEIELELSEDVEPRPKQRSAKKTRGKIVQRIRK